MATVMCALPSLTLPAAHHNKVHFFAKLIHNSTLSTALRLESAVNRDHQSHSTMPIDSDTYSSLSQACTNMKSLSEGRQIHALLLTSGLSQNIFLATKLVSMYGMCGTLVDARLVFDKISTRDVFFWNAMIKGYARNGFCEEALGLYYQMVRAGTQPDNFTFSCVVKVYTSLSALQEGKEIHGYIIRSGFGSDVFVGSALVDLYAKCGNTETARQVFDKISQRDVVSWNAMMAGYVQNGQCGEALKLLGQMQMSCVKPDAITAASVLPACTYLAALPQGMELHGYVIRNGFESNFHVGSALVAMYAKCRSMENACRVFDRMPEMDVVSWSTMITGFVQNGYCDKALEFFRRMQLAGVKPDSVTIASIFPACAGLAGLQQGKEIHGYSVRRGFTSDFFVGSALIDMYAKCSGIEFARRVFDGMCQRNVVSWNAIIAGYVHGGHCEEALKLLRQMQPAGVKPDFVTAVSVLPACASLASLQQGKEIHDYVIRNGFVRDGFVGDALIDMYAKCGYIEVAREVFNKMCIRRDVVSWNAMIAAYGMHGNGKDALGLLYRMQEAGVKPDYVTFIAVLSACSHAGLVYEGWQYFTRMNQDYCITPRMEHYACMVDLLGRAGHLDEAHDFIKKMPLEPDAAVLGAFLGACRLHCNIELGECVAERLFELEPENAGYYVLLSNTYAATARWDDVAKVRKLMKQRRLKKFPGCSWIQVKNRIHAFFGGGRSHPQSDQIYAMLESLDGQMKAAGYVLDMTFELHDVEE